MRKAIVEAREQAERERKARELAEKRLQIAVERISRLFIDGSVAAERKAAEEALIQAEKMKQEAVCIVTNA